MPKCPVPLPSRYKEEAVKTGGHGSVYICQDTELDRKVAIKCIANKANQRRLIDEIKALQHVKSKHVIEVYDLVITADEVAIILEYVAGDDLENANFSEWETIDFIRMLYQIICGINDIHDCKHIHRDIKRNNIRLDEEGIIKILDFGLSREVAVDDRTIGFSGTPPYAAPELYTTGQITFTPAVDIYAFGILAWKILANNLPSELRKRPPSELKTKLQDECDIPVQLADIINKSLSYSSVDRPTIQIIKSVFAEHLTMGFHKAAVNYGGQVYKIDAQHKSAEIGNKTDNLVINYDEVHFRIQKITGNVFINNRPAVEKSIMPKSCVITIGAGLARSFVTFDVSHPEITL